MCLVLVVKRVSVMYFYVVFVLGCGIFEISVIIVIVFLILLVVVVVFYWWHVHTQALCHAVCAIG